MSDKKQTVYAVGGEAYFGTYQIAGGASDVKLWEPPVNFEFPKSADVPEFEPFNIADLPPIEFTGTFEMSADEFERFMKPAWAYIKIGPHLFIVPDEPTQNADGTRTINMRYLEPGTELHKLAASAWWESVTRGKTRD